MSVLIRILIAVLPYVLPLILKREKSERIVDGIRREPRPFRKIFRRILRRRNG